MRDSKLNLRDFAKKSETVRLQKAFITLPPTTDQARTAEAAIHHADPRVSPRHSRARVILAFAAIYTIWGSTYFAIRVSIETIPPFLMAGGRFVVAGLLLYALARWRGAEPPTMGQWRSAALVGSLMFLGGNGALTWAELHVPSGLAALLLSIIPLWMVLLHHLELRRALGAQIILGLVLGLVGIAILVGPSQLLGGGQVVPAGASVLVAGSLCWAIGSLYSRHASMPKSSLLAAAMEMLSGSVGLLALGLVTGEVHGLTHPGISARSILAVAYLVVFGSLIAFTAYTWLLGVAGPSRVATYAYVNPVIAVFLGWGIGDEPLTARVFAAMAVILSAVALIIAHQTQSAPCKEELPPSGECPETVV
jgi:drug/metabolite transporter (DMT)-like permease